MEAGSKLEYYKLKHIMNLIKLKNLFLDFLLPRRCIGCDQPDTWWCDDCFRILNAEPTVSVNESPLDRLIVAAHYDTPLIKKAIQAFKYERHPEDIAPKLGKLLAQALGKHAGTLIPVPLERQREKERGFNQAELLAVEMKKYCPEAFTINSQLLTKNHLTLPQVGLSRQQRLENIRGAFSLHSPLQKEAHYILVDDVVTTGATLKECCRILKQHGAKEVWGLAVARNAV